MPGLVGVVQRSTEQPVKVVYNSFLAAMRDSERVQQETRIACDGRWALGRVHLGIVHPRPQLTDTDQIQVLFHGDLSNETELRRGLVNECLPLPMGNAIPLIRSLYRMYGNDFVSRLRGTFCILILDEAKKRLILATDRLGSYPLYWFKGPGRFVLASELKAVLRDPAIKPALNPQAVADYLSFGFLFGTKTLDSQVQLLPPASTLTYSWEDGSCTVEQYWRADAAFETWEGEQASYYQELREAFHEAVQRALGGGQSLGVSLSGGLDSRAVLSAIDCRQTSIASYTLGVKGCADEVIAQQLSRIAGTTHRFLEMDTAYVGGGLENLRTMVNLTDGMYLTHGLTEILALRFLEQADFSILLRGHGGELAKASLAWPLHTDANIYGMQSKEEFVPYFFNRVNYISRGVSLRELFQADWFERISGQAYRSLESSVDGVPLSPPDLCSYLYLTEHHRRFTIPSLELFRTVVEVRMPFVDQGFLATLFRGPAQWRDGTDIHRAIIRTNSSALMRVRNSNTGAPCDASPLAEKVWDKVNSVFKRLNVYGYRHYHSFERWLKQRLLDSVEQIMLHPDALERRTYRETTLRRLIEETRRGTADHAHLLQILLILELWQQENL